MRIDRAGLDSKMAGLPDSELLRIVGKDRDDYRPEALQCARAELIRRGVSIPPPPVAEPEKNPFVGMSPLTRVLSGLVVLVVLAAKLAPDLSDRPIHVSPSLGLALVSAMLWSIAWDVRSKRPLGVVLLACAVGLGAAYLAVREFQK
jgi:hypothetical protein